MMARLPDEAGKMSLHLETLKYPDDEEIVTPFKPSVEKTGISSGASGGRGR